MFTVVSCVLGIIYVAAVCFKKKDVLSSWRLLCLLLLVWLALVFLLTHITNTFKKVGFGWVLGVF